MAEIINLTPHDIHVIQGLAVAVFPKTGVVARVETTTVFCPPINNIPTSIVEYGKVVNLPEPKDGIFYLVSMPVGQNCTGRMDLIGPNTNEAIRDEKTGYITGVPGFVRYQ